MSYPHLGFDPAPGDVGEIDRLGDDLSQTSTALHEISSVLHGAANGQWRGKAAIAFRDMLDDDLRPKIDNAYGAFDEAKIQIHDWSVSLADFQSSAATYEQQAADAQARIDAEEANIASAYSYLNRLGPPPSSSDPEPETDDEQRELERDANDRTYWQGQLATARANKTAAEADLQAARDRADTLHANYLTKGQQIANRLTDAVDAAPDSPNMLQAAWDSVCDFADSIGDFLADVRDNIVQILQRLAPYLEVLGNICGIVSTVLGLLSLVPGLQFLAPFALGFAVAALAFTYLQKVGESGSFLEALTDRDVLISALGVSIGAGGFAAGARVASSAARTGLGASGVAEGGFGGLFSAAGKSMTMEEGLWRMAELHMEYGTLAYEGFNAGDTWDKIVDTSGAASEGAQRVGFGPTILGLKTMGPPLSLADLALIGTDPAAPVVT